MNGGRRSECWNGNQHNDTKPRNKERLLFKTASENIRGGASPAGSSRFGTHTFVPCGSLCASGGLFLAGIDLRFRRDHGCTLPVSFSAPSFSASLEFLGKPASKNNILLYRRWKVALLPLQGRWIFRWLLMCFYFTKYIFSPAVYFLLGNILTLVYNDNMMF